MRIDPDIARKQNGQPETMTGWPFYRCRLNNHESAVCRDLGFPET
jgi:hypothetical protein